MIKTTRSPIWLDIETGGVDPTKSSILSIAQGRMGDVKTLFNMPVEGTFLSSFSEQNIVPQLTRASELTTERQSIESLITTLGKNKESPLAGYNIRGFDIGFIQRRSRVYGLENKFIEALGKREIQDPVQQVKDVIAGSITAHLKKGTFSEELGGLSWEEAKARYKGVEDAPEAFKRLVQVETYRIGDEYQKFRGYKLEEAYSLLGKAPVAGKAHEAAADLAMTGSIWEGIRTGSLQQRLEQPEVARQWLSQVLGRKVQSTSGRLLTKSGIEELGLIQRPVWKKPWFIAGGVTLAAVLAVNKFSGRDDPYNSLEGLGHQGIAHQKRLELTDFGSGFKTAAGIAQRLTKVGSVAVKESIRSGIHISKEISHDAIKGRMPLAQGVLGLTVVEAAHIAETVANSAFTPASAAIAVGSFALAKVGYKGIKHKKEVQTTVTLARSNPALSKEIAKTTKDTLYQQLKDYVLTGSAETPVGAFLDLGGGDIGRQAALGRIEGLAHGGVASQLRKILTDFSSPVDLGKAVQRAEILYKSITKQLLAEKGIQGISIVGGISNKGNAISLFAKDSAGKTLISFNRTFSEKSVDLGNIFIDESIRGRFGRRFYEQEADIFRHIGYEGDTVTSTVVSPMTAKMQNRMYRSMPEDPEHMQLMPAILSGKLKKEDFLPGMFSMVGKIPGRDDAYNTIEGMKHGGWAQKLRKFFTPFGSGWDALRNLVKGEETFQKMISSKGFQKALQEATTISKVGEGAMGQAWRMRGQFRGKSFDFVRKIGDIGEDEANVMKLFQEDFAPTMYRESMYEGRPFIDMELIKGQTARSVQQSGGLSQESISSIKSTVGKMHEMGLAHGDPHLGNVMITPEGRTALIDYGTSGRIGGEFRSYSREGIAQLRVNEADYRSATRDLEVLAESLGQTPATPSRAIKKSAQSNLQRAAVKTVWENGKTGGRRSRM